MGSKTKAGPLSVKGYCPGAFCQGRGAFVQWLLYKGLLSKGFFSGVLCPRGILSRGFFPVGFVLVGFFPGSFCPRVFCPGGFCLGLLLSRGFLPKALFYEYNLMYCKDTLVFHLCILYTLFTSFHLFHQYLTSTTITYPSISLSLSLYVILSLSPCN